MKKSILVFVVAMMAFTGMANAQGARNLPPRPTLTGPVADLLNAIVVAMKGTQSMTFRKVGNDWQVVFFHNAVDPGGVTHR